MRVQEGSWGGHHRASRRGSGRRMGLGEGKRNVEVTASEQDPWGGCSCQHTPFPCLQALGPSWMSV